MNITKMPGRETKRRRSAFDGTPFAALQHALMAHASLPDDNIALPGAFGDSCLTWGDLRAVEAALRNVRTSLEYATEPDGDGL